MATSYYSTGTVSLTNGSAVVTGVGTGWQMALISGGNVIVQAPGNVLPIASVDSDSQITAELEWTGETGTYPYAIQRDTAYLKELDANSRNLAYLITELRAGTIFKYEQSGDLAGRDLYDSRPKNFGYLVTIGVSDPEFYVKASATEGDWAGPFPYGTGPVGPAPTLAIGAVTTLDAGAAATASVTGVDGDYEIELGIPQGVQGFKGWTMEPEVVAYGDFQVLRVSDFVGGEGAKPSGVGLYIGTAGLVADIADAVNVRGIQGPQGNRGVAWRGSWTAVDAYSTGDIVVDVDALDDAATFIAITANTNSKPRDNPATWGYFPASVPASINDGIWGDTITETANDGVWGA